MIATRQYPSKLGSAKKVYLSCFYYFALRSSTKSHRKLKCSEEMCTALDEKNQFLDQENNRFQKNIDNLMQENGDQSSRVRIQLKPSNQNSIKI